MGAPTFVECPARRRRAVCGGWAGPNAFNRLPMQTDNPRLTELRSAISERLRKVCSTMPPDEFEGLVQRIAEVEYKYERIQERDELGVSPRELNPPRQPEGSP